MKKLVLSSENSSNQIHLKSDQKSKLKSLTELTEGMNEFEKFIFFKRRAEDLDKLRSAWLLLSGYSDLSINDIRKRMRVSVKAWDSFMAGTIPLPWDFIIDFCLCFKEELEGAQARKNQNGLNGLIDLLRSCNKVA